ncbi:MAG: formate/nitrite transporter family protein [Oscillospiraceae bacterium]|nr:formate/nitrite transporter family protein [Oscillospiraceae bacterium]
MNSISNTLSPQQIVAANIAAAKGKAQLPLLRMILLGMFAGMFIACGASASSVAMHAVSNVGLARLVAGCIFPVGLMMIVFVGGELFTGDCLMVMGCLNREIRLIDMLRVLTVVFLSNFVGAVVMAAMVSTTTQFGFTGNMLGAFTIKVAMGKINMSFGTAFVSGILCNIFVCVAVLMAAAAQDIAGKVWAIFFPIMAFVVSGYEHCVANMYYVPAGIFAAANADYAEAAMTAYGYTAAQMESLNWGNFLVNNLMPVTLGNIVGGMIFVGLPLYLIHAEKIKAECV